MYGLIQSNFRVAGWPSKLMSIMFSNEEIRLAIGGEVDASSCTLMFDNHAVLVSIPAQGWSETYLQEALSFLEQPAVLFGNCVVFLATLANPRPKSIGCFTEYLMLGQSGPKLR
jgi:hypothetical protein